MNIFELAERTGARFEFKCVVVATQVMFFGEARYIGRRGVITVLCATPKARERAMAGRLKREIPKEVKRAIEREDKR